MGWSIGYDSDWNRDIGYAVPAHCDHPGCRRKIDRGVAYVCGGQPYGGGVGCGLFFCSKHLWFGRSVNAPQLCARCMKYKKPFNPKPDHKEWISWKMRHPSWSQWRKENGYPEPKRPMRTED